MSFHHGRARRQFLDEAATMMALHFAVGDRIEMLPPLALALTSTKHDLHQQNSRVLFNKQDKSQQAVC